MAEFMLAVLALLTLAVVTHFIPGLRAGRVGYPYSPPNSTHDSSTAARPTISHSSRQCEPTSSPFARMERTMSDFGGYRNA